MPQHHTMPQHLSSSDPISSDPIRSDPTSSGDRARRRAGTAFLLFLLALPLNYWLFTSLPTLWSMVEPLEGAAFMLAATLLGAALAIAPLASAVGFILALWFGVESVYMPRSRTTPLLDRIIVIGGLLTWFSPTITAFGLAARSVAEGRVHFVRPPRDYFLATDPIAFWQGLGFWLIMGALFAFLAWRYWRGKLLRHTVSN